MVALQPLISEFTIVGRLEDVAIDSKGRIKHLYLSSPEADYSVEVTKEQKVADKRLKPGCYLKVRGMQKYELHKERVKYKAYYIELLSEQIESTDVDRAIAKSKPKAKILICQGSTCWQRGKAVYEKLQQEICSQGIAKQVEIKTIGCLKQCKQAPSLRTPDRHRHGRVQPQQASKLIADVKDFLNSP